MITAIFFPVSGISFTRSQFLSLPAMRSIRSSMGATSFTSIAPTAMSCTPQDGMGSMQPSSSGQITAAITSIGESPVGDSCHFSTSRTNMGAGAKIGTFSSFSNSTVNAGFPPSGPPFILNHIRLITASTSGLPCRKK